MERADITILSRSDVNVVRVHAGPDWQAAAERLSDGHCFSVTPLLVVPNAHAGVAERVHARLYQHAAGNAWYRCSPLVAVSALIAELTGEATGPEATRSGLARQTTLCESEPPAPASPPCPPLEALASDPERSDDLPSDDELWSFVDPCAPRDADKAPDVRAALRASLGRAKADQVLVPTRSVVAPDADGHRRRILRIGAHALRLRGV